MRPYRFPWRGGLIGFALALVVADVVRRAAGLGDDLTALLTFVLAVSGSAAGMAYEMDL